MKKLTNQTFSLGKNKGFSLLETVVYVTLLAILSISVVNTIIVTVKATPSLKVTQNINYSSGLVMDRLTREIRTAYDIDLVNSTFDASLGRLTLKTTQTDETLTTIEFYISNGVLNVKEAGIDQGSLISQDTQIKNLIFRQVNTNNSKAVKIELEIESKLGQLPQNKQKSATFYNTVILRGSY